MTNRTIPRPEVAHQPLGETMARKASLDGEVAGLRAEAADIRRRLLAHGDLKARASRIEAIATGGTFEDPGPLQDRLTAVLRDLRDKEDALAIVHERLRAEERAASRVVSELFAGEHKAMLGRLCTAIAAAVHVRLEIDELHHDLRKAGVEPTGIRAAGDFVFDEAMNRASHVATELRRAAREGIIPAKIIPEALR